MGKTKKSSITRRVILLMAAGLCVIVLLAFIFRHQILYYVHAALRYTKTNYTASAKCNGCAAVFTDGIAAHQKAYAGGKGIAPQSNDEQLDVLFQNGSLVKVSSNKFYHVQSMSESKPYIVSECSDFLMNLSSLYHQRCLDSGISYHPFTISSGTRSKESVKRLIEEKGNPNAIRNSPHLLGKTIDIRYDNFGGKEKQLSLFTMVLKEMRDARKCFVKYEKNGCLHITAN